MVWVCAHGGMGWLDRAARERAEAEADAEVANEAARADALEQQLSDASALHRSMQAEVQKLTATLQERSAQVTALVETVEAHQVALFQSPEQQMEDALADEGVGVGAAGAAQHRRAVAALSERCVALAAQLTTAHAVEACLERNGVDLQSKISAMVALDAERVRVIEGLERRLATAEAATASALRKRDMARGEVLALNTSVAAAEKSCRTLELQVGAGWWLYAVSRRVCACGGVA